MTAAASAPQQLDPFSVSVVIATSMGMGEFAPILGAYSVILLGGLGGAAWSASGKVGLTRMGVVLHVLLMMGLALVTTVPLAELIKHFTNLEIRWLLAPLAIGIAARPDFVFSTLRRWFQKRIGLEDEPVQVQPQPPKETQP